MKKRFRNALSVIMTVLIFIGTVPVTGFAFTTDYGTLKITTSPAGADVYIDGERYVQKCTPCTIPLSEGEHKIDLVIKGYEECGETVVIAAGEETVIEEQILPEIPSDDAVIITVTTENDSYIDESLTVDDIKKLSDISLRQALTAIEHDESNTWYRIEFAENVNHIELQDRFISFSRDNLIINGDRDRNGTPDVLFTKTEWGLLFRPMNNLYIMGIRFDDDSSGDSAIGIRPDDNYRGDVSYENIYVLGCEFNNCEIIPFCGACKMYDSYGKVDYTNINACGNILNNSNMFFAYSGNTDYSTTDGMTYQSNKLDSTSVLSLMCADCNTNYIYGGDNEASNGESCDRRVFETSDHNTVKNVLICGNDGGCSSPGVAVNGNSYNTIKDVVYRNNRFDDTLNIRPCQPIDDRNEGNTLTMIGNTLENILFEYNIFDYADNDACPYLGILDFDECSPDTHFILEDNVSRNIIFKNNLFLGHGLFIGDGAYNGAHEYNIEKGIDYSVNGGYVIAQAHVASDITPNHYTNVNNRYEGIMFEENRKVQTYDPYAIWDDSPVHIHIPEYISWNGAHCVEDGHEQYYTCYCGRYFRDWACEDEIADIELWLKTEGCFPATGHAFGDTTVIKPTCHSGGYSVRQCTKCGDYEEFDITEKLNHDYQPEGTVPATCNTQGYTNYVCTYCGDAFLGDFVDNTGHSFTNYIFNNDATCTQEGTMTAKCDYCDATDTVLAENTIIEHKFSTEESTQNSGCVTYKVTKYTCDTCGYEKTETEAVATSHIYDVLWVWKSFGDVEAVFTCRRCDESDLRHASVSAKTIRQATCNEPGLERYTATIYFNDAIIYTNSKDRTVPELTHKIVNGKLIPATCQRPAQQEEICELCGELMDHDEVGEKLPHTSDKGTVTKKATCTAAGTKTYKCTSCGDVLKTETIKATGHKEVVLKAVTATAKKSGLTAGKKCSVCGKVLVAQKMTLAQVTGLKASAVAKTSIKLTWTKIAGAKYYKVEQSTDGKTWKTIKTVDTNSYTVSKLTAGKKYQFRVKALDSTKKIAGKASTVLKTGTLTSAPTVTLKSSKSKTAVASWKKVTGASKYVVYKSTDGKKWTKVTTTTKLTYTLTKLTGGKKIYVKVTAVNAYSKESAASTVKNVTVKK